MSLTKGTPSSIDVRAPHAVRFVDAATPAKIASLNHKYNHLHSRCGVVGPNQINQISFAAVEETEEDVSESTSDRTKRRHPEDSSGPSSRVSES